MTVKAQKPIVIFRGDNTAAFDLRTITILLTGDLDLSHATAEFTLLDFSKTWTEQEVATGELSIVFTDEQTNAFALGPQTGTLRLYDMSTGTPRQLTIVNKIPFFVTNRVCEIDSQSYEADVCVSGGDVIHIEFKVGAGAVEGKANKVKSATAGDLASLTADGNLEDSGIPKTDVLRKSQMDSTPTEGSSNPVTSDGIKQAIDAATPSDYAEVKAQVAANTGDIAEIESLIPAQASAQNQLADRNFVNSSIATNTATFRGSYNLVSDLELTVSATEQQVAAAIAAKLASLVPPVVPENNDYVFVQVPKTGADPTVIERVDRYKCTVTESGGVTTRVWEYEWSLNNSSFTADQWAAINSGMTAADVTKLAGIQAGAQVNTVTGVKGNAEQDYRTGNINLTPANIGALGNTGNQRLSGTLTVNDIETDRVELYTNGGLDAIGLAGNGLRNPNNDSVVISWPSLGSSDTLALLSDIYAAVRQIAPDFTAKAYALNELCSYNGVVYRCKSAYTATAQSTKPNADTTHWEAKPASELFLGNSGDQTLSGGSLTIDKSGPDGDIWLQIKRGNQNGLALCFNGFRFDDKYIELPFAAGILALRSDILVKSVKLNGTALEPDANGAVDVPALPLAGGEMSGDIILSKSGYNSWRFSNFLGTMVLSVVGGGANILFPNNKSGTLALISDLPYAIASVPSGDKLADRTVNTKTVNAATYAPSFPTETSGKSCDFYLAITSDTAGTVSAPSGKTLNNAMGESANLDYEANKTTVLRFTQIGVNTYVVTGGANGGGGATPNLDYVMRVDPETGNIYYTTPDTNA